MVAAMLSATSASAAIINLIDDDFTSGSVSTNSRIRTNQAGGGWFKDNTPVSEWTISGGVLSSAGSGTGSATEGALSQVIATDSLSGTLSNLNLSFDYTVGATSTLKFALIGYTANLQLGGTADGILMNNGTSNGSLQNNSQSEQEFGDINLLTGADMSQSITNDLTFAAGTTGSYSQTFDLSLYSWHADEAAGAAPTNTPGLSGGITSIADFDYVALVVVNDLSTATGASGTSLDNFTLSASSVAVPEPTTFALLGFGMIGFAWKRRRNIFRSSVSS